MIERHKVSKCSWENGVSRLVGCRVATNLQFVKKKKKKRKKRKKEKRNTKKQFSTMFVGHFKQ